MTEPSGVPAPGPSGRDRDGREPADPKRPPDPKRPNGPGDPKGHRTAKAPQRRKQVLLRLDPLVYEALARWAGDELRSANAQIEFLLRRALAEAGRLPSGTRPVPRRGRPPADPGTS